MRCAEIQGHLGQLGAKRGQRRLHFDLRRQDQPGQGDRPQNLHAGEVVIASAVSIQWLAHDRIPENCCPVGRDFATSGDKRPAERLPVGQGLPDALGDFGNEATRSIGKSAAVSHTSHAAGRNCTIFPKSGRLARLSTRASSSSKSSAGGNLFGHRT